ncbi:serine protease [Salininema proteolyticum]|uniref:Serine protease n=1 Tax=Salininema proteolyticum TaxID=1607685 RepID=A0ABV8U0C3_9ACTN
MKNLIRTLAATAAAAVGALALTASAGASGMGAQVIGGDPAEEGQFPYLVSLQSGGHFCGGSLIAEDVVLTAAHCVEGSGPGDFTVKHGSVALDSPDMNEYEVADVEVAPDYGQGSRFSWDWALVQLTEPVEGAETVALSDGSVDEGPTFTVAGWGVTDDGGLANEQQFVEVPFVDDQTCSEAYGSSLDPESMVCAGDVENGGVDSCQGDSGGPLVAGEEGSHVLAGIVSWGQGCAEPGYPGVYSQVSSFRDDVENGLARLG